MQVAFFVLEIKMMKDLAVNQMIMTSLEIAELTAKEHKNVIADIRTMLQQLGNLTADFSALITAQILTPEIQELIIKHLTTL